MTSVTSIRSDHERRLEMKLRRELGERLLWLLAEDGIEDILLNPDSSLWVKRQGAAFDRVGSLSSSQASVVLATIAAWRETVLNHDSPILETELPLGGSRFEGIVQPVVARPVFAIRRAASRVYTLADFEANEIITSRDDQRNRARSRENFNAQVASLSHAEILRCAISLKKNVLVVGSTGSGKTTLVNALLDALADLCPADRVISIEDTLELQCRVENYVPLHATGRITMLDCLRACMRLKPDRIVVGEVRGAEAHTLLKAWNTGHPGGFATLHANDGLSGLIRLESLVAEATTAPQQALIGEAVDVVVFIDNEPDSTALKAGRKVRQILLVQGYSHGEYLTERV